MQEPVAVNAQVTASPPLDRVPAHVGNPRCDSTKCPGAGVVVTPAEERHLDRLVYCLAKRISLLPTHLTFGCPIMARDPEVPPPPAWTTKPVATDVGRVRVRRSQTICHHRPPPSEQRRSSQHWTDDKWRQWTYINERSRPDPHIRSGQLRNRSSSFSHPHREDPFLIGSQPLTARSPDRDGWQASNREYDDPSPRRRSFDPDSLSPEVPSHSGDRSYRRRARHVRTHSDPNR